MWVYVGYIYGYVRRAVPDSYGRVGVGGASTWPDSAFRHCPFLDVFDLNVCLYDCLFVCVSAVDNSVAILAQG